jgi:hypothetical protein
VRLHSEVSPILDTLGLTSGDALFDNLAVVEAAIQQGHPESGRLTQWAAQLHAYVGVKAKIFEIDTQIKKDHINYVIKDADDLSYANGELRDLEGARKAYAENFARYELSDAARSDYDAFLGPLNELHKTLGSDLLTTF